MSQPFIRRFRVRHYEVDALGQVHDFIYVRYMQEAAIEASTALGFSPNWYHTHGALWIIRRLAIRYHEPLAYGDEVQVATWILGMRGARSTREYELTRVHDGRPVARARAEWVYMDTTTGQPARIPDDWASAFPAPRTVADLPVRLRHSQRTERPIRYSTRRRVTFTELDTVQHVNHANYVRWCSEACRDAFRMAGYPIERTRQEAWTMRPAGFEIQYFAPAHDHDNIEIVSWVAETTKLRAAWMHEVFNAESRKLLASAYSLGVFVNLANRPTPPPFSAMAAIGAGAGLPS